MAKMQTEELLDTEKRYVEALKEIVHGYIPMMDRHKHQPDEHGLQMPKDLIGGKDRILRGNIKALLSFHENVILPEFHKAAESDPRHFEVIFRRHMDSFKAEYGEYCLDLPKSQLICGQNTDYFHTLHMVGNFRQSLPSRLGEVHPRIGRCALLLQGIGKSYRKAKDVAEKNNLKFDLTQQLRWQSIIEAEDLVNKIGDYANGMMDAGRIDGYDVRMFPSLLNKRAKCISWTF